MKPLPVLLCGLLLFSTMIGASAAEPATAPPPAAPAPTNKPATKTPPPAVPAAPEVASLKPSDYIDALTTSLALSDPEKKEVTDLYEADGAAIQKIGNDATLSPLQKAQQISDLRNERNSKIEDILHDIDRKKTFHDVEVVYRVEVTEIALDGQLLPPAPPAPAAPAPAPAPAKGTPPSAANAAPAPAPAAKPAPTE